MCNLCNGSHVIHELEGSFIGYHSCPNCGPLTDEQIKNKYAHIRSQIAEVKGCVKQ